MSHKVKWHRIKRDHEPLVNTFWTLWWWDGDTIGAGRYQGNGAWKTGMVHDRITHWAEMDFPLPPEDFQK